MSAVVPQLRLAEAWHVLPTAAAANALAVDVERGLDPAEAAERRARHGLNRLPEKRGRSSWKLYLGQFSNPLMLVLFIAAGLAAAVGNLTDAAVILVVINVNALVGFYQEHRAERSLAALKRMLPVRARARRAGVQVELAAEELVPGDLVLLEAGDQVPADGRLMRMVGLEIDESALTGESSPAAKDPAALADPGTPLADRVNLVYMNTIVARGKGEMLVTATGAGTEIGRISEALAATRDPPSPLQIQLDQLGKQLGAVALGLVGLLFVLEMLRGSSLVQEILDAIALAVAAVPEGLPVVVTVTLALGMQQMARRHAIVKRLSSVETLGCTTVICSDKTGTLTLNQMTVRDLYCLGRRWSVSGEGYQREGALRDAGGAPPPDLSEALVPLVGCNDSRVHEGKAIGDPTEAALLVLAAKARVNADEVAARLPRIAEVPFDSGRKFMATFHRDGGQVRLFAKGAPDVLLQRCARRLGPQGEEALDATGADEIRQAYAQMAEGGRRGLLIASRTLPALAAGADLEAMVRDLTFVALAGLADPPRPGAREAIARCHEAGISVMMITGDHRDTAVAVARELGLSGEAIAGAQVEALGEEELGEALEKVAVVARVAPEHKVKIVRALQRRGHVVAMTGDGVNDAPALKHADIGVAMGRGGTEVSKEAASMVLADDDFSTIVTAVEQGRRLYDNILKFVRFQLSTTVGAILTLFFSPLLGLPEAFPPVQILWVAMIMDGPPAVSLALDAAHPGIMRERPRQRGEPVLSAARLLRILVLAVLMMVGSLAMQRWGLATGSQGRALTLAFTTFVLFQFFNIFNARAENESAMSRQFFANRALWAALAGVVAMQAVAVHWPPAQAIFRTEALSARDWLLCAAVASSVLVLEELRKLLRRLVRGRNR